MTNHLSVERDILISTARASRSETSGASIRRGLQNGHADWTIIVEAALEHGTAALLCHHLVAEAPLLPTELASAAAEFIVQSSQNSLISVTELLRVVDALQAAGVQVIPYKGPLLAATYYGDVSLRSFRDLDLLIRENDLPAAVKALKQLGYSDRSSELRERHLRVLLGAMREEIFHSEGRITIEIHWSITPRSQVVDLEVSGAWERAVQIPLFGRLMLSLSPEDTLTMLALHGCKERWKRLLWVADVAELLRSNPGLDWHGLLARAAVGRFERMVLLAVSLANEVLSAPVPEEIRRLAQADAICRRLVNRYKAILFAGAAPETTFEAIRFYCAVLKHPSDRLLFLVRYFNEPRIEHLSAVDLPDWLAWAYPAVRLALRLRSQPLRRRLWGAR